MGRRRPELRAAAAPLLARYRCIAYNARGYPPSDVPDDVDRYSQDRARDDILAVLDGLGIDRAHVVGTSMGAFATLHFGLTYPDRARSLVLTGCGYGAEPDSRELFVAETLRTAETIETAGMAAAARQLRGGAGPGPVPGQGPAWLAGVRDPARGALGARIGRHPARRPGASTLALGLTDRMRVLELPTLVITGDEDHACLAPGILLKQTIPTAALAVVPNTGHAVNTEEPDIFNRLVGDFLHQVEAGRWPRRDPRAVTTTIYGR